MRFAEMSEATRIGLVGAGAVGQRHAKVLGGFADVELAGVADVDAALAERVATEHGARGYEGVEQMLEREQLDAAYICVPPFAHGPPERAVLAAGLPFFVEKPLAVDLSTAVAIADEVRAAGVVTAAGYHWRYLDTVEAAAAQLAETQPRLLVGAWLDKLPPPAWWSDRTRSGGQTIEQTTHVLDVMRVLAGGVDQVYAVGARTEGDRATDTAVDEGSAALRPAATDTAVDDVSAATLRFANGAIGSLASTCLLGSKHRAGVEVFGDGLALSLSETELALDRGDGAAVTQAAFDAKRQVDRDFVDAVQGRENRIRAPYGEALATHRLACALALSAERGEAVEPANVDPHA
jgi:predicted dehydrogenase